MSLTGELEYRIVVPSRKRSHLMGHLLQLIPSATIAVHETELADYQKVVPAEQLVTHTQTSSVVAIRNWLLNTFTEPYQIQIDDDLEFVETQIGARKKRITDPDQIEWILENQIVCMADLGIGVGCFSRNRNEPMVKPSAYPFRVVGPLSCTMIIGGTARRRRFASECWGRADADFTLRTLQEDRILLADMRFVFFHGAVFAGKGGNVGVLNQEQFNKATAALKKRWGKYIATEKKGRFGKKDKGNPAMSIAVKRSASTAIKK
jgi:hypothetical protein